MRSPEFEKAFESFFKGVIVIYEKHMSKNFPNSKPETFIYHVGKRYMKLIRTFSHQQQSVFCFVDITNGDVLKAASWRSPAKHARGNIFDQYNGLSKITAYGPEYLK